MWYNVTMNTETQNLPAIETATYSSIHDLGVDWIMCNYADAEWNLGYVASEELAGDENERNGLQTRSYPDMVWPGAVSSGSIIPDQGSPETDSNDFDAVETLLIAEKLRERFNSVNDLTDSQTNEVIRPATVSERIESLNAGYEGHINVDGYRCFVD